MRETILPFTYAVREILDYPSDVYFSNTGDMVGMFECMFGEFGIFCDIDYNADISRIKVNVKYDIEYDCSRGAILSVLYLDDNPIAIYMGAGRSNEDTNRFITLDYLKCIEVINLVRVKDTLDEVHIFNEDDKIDLLFWEGTPVDLGEFGYKEVK